MYNNKTSLVNAIVSYVQYMTYVGILFNDVVLIRHASRVGDVNSISIELIPFDRVPD